MEGVQYIYIYFLEKEKVENENIRESYYSRIVALIGILGPTSLS